MRVEPVSGSYTRRPTSSSVISVFESWWVALSIGVTPAGSSSTTTPRRTSSLAPCLLAALELVATSAPAVSTAYGPALSVSESSVRPGSRRRSGCPTVGGFATVDGGNEVGQGLLVLGRLGPRACYESGGCDIGVSSGMR
jgi:hypothetical protein